MRMPTTVKGYVKLMKQIERTTLFDLTGFDELPKETQKELHHLSATISNFINEIDLEKKIILFS